MIQHNLRDAKMYVLVKTCCETADNQLHALACRKFAVFIESYHSVTEFRNAQSVIL